MSDLTASEEEMDMTVLSQPMADQPRIPPHLVLSFHNETYRQRNVIIIDHFPDLAPFIQTAKLVRKKNSEEFNRTKSQFHRLNKIITKAKVEYSQHQTKSISKS